MIRGKVVLVPFPFDDLSTTKARPVVCLTEPVGPYRHVIVAFITSRIPPDLLESDVVLDANEADFTATGLRVSYASPDYGYNSADSAGVRRIVAANAG